MKSSTKLALDASRVGLCAVFCSLAACSSATGTSGTPTEDAAASSTGDASVADATVSPTTDASSADASTEAGTLLPDAEAGSSQPDGSMASDAEAADLVDAGDSTVGSPSNVVDSDAEAVPTSSAAPTTPAATISADASPNLPAEDAGEDPVPQYGNCTMIETHVPSEGADHTTEGNVVDYVSNPPASGTHYPRWTAFGAYDVVVPTGYWLHNLEHGAMVFLHGPDADAQEEAALNELFEDMTDPSCPGGARKILTPYPELETKIAIVAWDWTLTGDCVNAEQIAAFINEHIGQGLEDLCEPGAYVPN
jgi:Protein of unknown function (DUF3105)